MWPHRGTLGDLVEIPLPTSEYYNADNHSAEIDINSQTTNLAAPQTASLRAQWQAILFPRQIAHIRKRARNKVQSAFFSF